MVGGFPASAGSHTDCLSFALERFDPPSAWRSSTCDNLCLRIDYLLWNVCFMIVDACDLIPPSSSKKRQQKCSVGRTQRWRLWACATIELPQLCDRQFSHKCRLYRLLLKHSVIAGLQPQSVAQASRKTWLAWTQTYRQKDLLGSSTLRSLLGAFRTQSSQS